MMIDSERRHALVLRAWEATNIERDLRSVMGAVADVLSPYVPIDGMGDISEEVRAGRFRDDLYYRLNVFPIRIPPLRERLEDIGALAARIAAKHAARLNRTIERIDKKSLKLLESYDWPGNVRELENVVERAIILSRHGTLRIERDFLGSMKPNGNVGQHLRNEERETIESALRLSHGRVSGPNGAASRLGLPASTLEFRIKRLGIDKFSFR